VTSWVHYKAENEAEIKQNATVETYNVQKEE